MSHTHKSMTLRQRLLQLGRKTLIHLDDHFAPGTDQMMVMTIIPFHDQFKSGRAIAKIKPTHQTHVLQGVQVSVHRRQIAALLAQGGMDFPVAHRVLMTAQDLQDGLPRTSDLARVPFEPGGQLGERLLHQAMRMSVLIAGSAHAGRERERTSRIRWAARETRNNPTEVSTIVGPHGELTR